jgi:hypothetical protein
MPGTRSILNTYIILFSHILKELQRLLLLGRRNSIFQSLILLRCENQLLFQLSFGPSRAPLHRGFWKVAFEAVATLALPAGIVREIVHLREPLGSLVETPESPHFLFGDS